MSQSLESITHWLLNAGYFLLMALGLGFVIFVHELGHFAVAKWAGVLVERFSIGFGPILWSRKWGETEYALSAIPLGGYVKMLGQDDIRPAEMARDDLKLDPRSYPAQTIPKRMAIISAGVVMNIIFGLLFFILVFNLGVPVTPPVVGAVEPGSPAWAAGLERGDRIMSADAEEMIEFEQFFQKVMLSGSDEPMRLVVERAGDKRSVSVTPRRTPDGSQIGVEPSSGLVLSAARPVDKDMAAGRTEGGQFRAGDRIIGVNGRPVASYAEFANFLAEHASEAIQVSVERAPKDKTRKGELAEMTVPPQYMRSFGMLLQMGKISAVQPGSPADDAGIKVGDVIQTVDGKSVDPLRLPHTMYELAGRGVELEVKRHSQGEAVAVPITVRPAERPAWLTPPRFSGRPQPMTVPALGIAYEIVPAVVAEPAADSPAARAGVRNGDVIVEAALVSPVEEGKPQSKPRVYKASDKDPMLPVVFWALQFNPKDALKLKVLRENTEVALEPFSPELDPGFPAPIRGIGLTLLSETLPPKGVREAIVLGYKTTRSTMLSIYLMLRRLVTGKVSVKNLVGPVGIAELGFYAAATDYRLLLKFLALLSVNLAIINFLPIPVLDGGHMFFLTWEAIRGKPPSERIQVSATYAGLLLILLLALFVTWQDIWRAIRF